jgi:hypothetical protein
MAYWFKRKYRQIKRVLDYLPIIWKGYDFDYRYAIDLFKHQLIRTSNFMESDRAYAIDSDMRAKRIKTAIELLDKVYDEEYGMEYQDQMKKIYGDNVLDWNFEDTGRGDGTSYINYEYEKWENKDKVKETFDKLFKQSKEKQIRAEKLVWKFISHNIRGWWD